MSPVHVTPGQLICTGCGETIGLVDGAEAMGCWRDAEFNTLGRRFIGGRQFRWSTLSGQCAAVYGYAWSVLHGPTGVEDRVGVEWCGPVLPAPPEWDTLTAKEHAEAHIREAVGRVRGREDAEWLFTAYRDALRRSDAQELQRTIAALHAIYNLLMPPALFTSMDGSHNNVPPSIQSIRLARQIAGRRRVEPPEEPPVYEEVGTFGPEPPLIQPPPEGPEPAHTLADMTRVSTTRADNGGGYTHRRRLAHWALARDRESAAMGGGGLRTLCGTFLTTGRIQTASAAYPDCGRCLRGLRTHYGIVPSGIVTAGAGTP